MVLKNKNILVGVTGGIAAYKAAELVSTLRKRDANVRVIMTKSAAEFVTPVTFQTLSGFPVRHELFTDWSKNFIPHIENALWADAVAIVPATANIIGKVAQGIADDLLSTTVMACEAPVLFAPAMNERMFKNPIVQRNIKTLKDLGYYFIEPAEGRLACGEVGKGRLAEIDTILWHLENVLSKKDFAGIKVLVTAGGTQEPIDPVRYISNRSSGKMGYGLAEALSQRGAEVALISAPTELKAPYGVELIKVETAREMYQACMERFDGVNMVIKCAAVADFEPADYSGEKIKKDIGFEYIKLKRTPDILSQMGRLKSHQFLIGFCAESQNLEERAKRKLKEKNLDLIVANDITKNIFGSDTTSIVIIDASNNKLMYDGISKKEAAHFILDAAIKKYRKRMEQED
ncbi:MAG: bifunctional phosphopantothenoylcysteine decarboxylase/phosphopantothenate--cysteine ligase CoaBC [Clostridia bacterium]|nr:bifunctional phosphopantothenoylcysteine decarboxylase/phosphopantothenate--cysteine ligase CoaBC [Clostridia bacterium]